MSKQAALEFWSRVLREPELSQQMERSLAATKPEERAEQIVRLGAEKGFQFTRDELAGAEVELRALLEGELSDDALAGVAGGGSFDVLRALPLLRANVASMPAPTVPSCD